MRELIGGDGGSVLVAAATAPDAVALACEGLASATTTPSGLPVYPAESVPMSLEIDRVRIVPCERATRETLLAWAGERDVVNDLVDVIDPPDGVRVVSVESRTTGSGKTALVRRVARTLQRSGLRVSVARHPIANLLGWDRFDPTVLRTPPELAAPRPIEEREELAPLLGAGIPVVSGLDAERIVRLAAREADVIVWDGGGAATPWLRPDIRLQVVDLLRSVSEDDIGAADAYVLTKADTATSDAARNVEALIRRVHPDAPIVLADLSIGVQPTNVLPDRRVVVVEDANSLILGGLSAGAGAVAARRFRCGVVDPRPFAVGAIADALASHVHIGAVIPSLGRTLQEIDDLARSVQATPGDAILWASNADPATVLTDEMRPVVRAFGELTEVAGPPLQDLLASLLPGHA